MPSKVSVLAGPVTRSYSITQNAKLHTVSLFHNTVTGLRVLTVDGSEVVGTQGSTTLFSPRKSLVFQIDGGCGEVIVTHEGTHVTYTAYWSAAGPEGAGVELQEENEVVNGTADSEGKEVNRLRIEIQAADTGVDEGGKPISWYRIKTLRENDEKEVIVHRRFRDFFSVEEQLRSSYKGSHLLASFPELPPRTFAGSMVSSLFGLSNHLEPGFVEERRSVAQYTLFPIDRSL
jgi:PX domain